MEKITRDALVRRLKQTKGTTAVTLVTKTVKNGQFKVARRTGMVGFSYENSVNNQRKREGKEADFKPITRAWGKRIEGTPIVENKGKQYVELKQTSCQVYHGPQDEPVKQHNQGVDKDVVLRDINIENIISIHTGGRVYEVC